VLAFGFLAFLGVRSLPGTASAEPAAPNPGHTWSEIGDVPGTLASRAVFSATTVDSTGYVGEFPSATIGADGLPIIVYYEESTPRKLKAVHCGNTACTSGNTITTLESAVDVGWYNSLTVGKDGLPTVSYYDDDHDNLLVKHCSSADCTAGGVTVAVDSTGDVGYESSVTVGKDGLPLVAYHDTTNGDLKVAHCGNVDCTSANSTTKVHDGTYTGLESSVTVGSDGLPIIFYWNNDGDDLYVAHCGNDTCTTSNTIAAMDSTGSVGRNPSVAIGVDGLAVVSYTDMTNTSLKVLHCTSADCTNNVINTVDNQGDTGYHSSLTIGADGLPVISYSDQSHLDLKVVHCGNTACSSGNTVTTVDSTGNVGDYSAVVVGVDGLPLIAYYDDSNGDLKVVHCSNLFCVPYHRPR
jgi:predicted regulator of Ras-like GTPase activity (Roadblock/LC7/MglB family)